MLLFVIYVGDEVRETICHDLDVECGNSKVIKMVTIGGHFNLLRHYRQPLIDATINLRWLLILD